MHSLVAVQGGQGQTSREPQSTPFLFSIRHVITTCGMYWSVPRKKRVTNGSSGQLATTGPDFFGRGLQHLSARFNRLSISTTSTIQDFPCISYESSLPHTHKYYSELPLMRYSSQRISRQDLGQSLSIAQYRSRKPSKNIWGAFFLISGVENRKMRDHYACLCSRLISSDYLHFHPHTQHVITSC